MLEALWEFVSLSYPLHFFQAQVSRSIIFPPAARKMETLNDLLAASDVISLHCALTDETVQIINAECLQHIKPGNLNYCMLKAIAFHLVSLFDVNMYFLFRGISGEHWKQSAFG